MYLKGVAKNVPFWKFVFCNISARWHRNCKICVEVSMPSRPDIAEHKINKREVIFATPFSPSFNRNKSIWYTCMSVFSTLCLSVCKEIQSTCWMWTLFHTKVISWHVYVRIKLGRLDRTFNYKTATGKGKIYLIL